MHAAPVNVGAATGEAYGVMPTETDEAVLPTAFDEITWK